MKNEMEKIRKETVVAEFKIVSRHLFEGTDENHEKPVKTPVSGPRCEPSTY
jgi:hypothetical protein